MLLFMDYVLFCGVAARLILALSTVVHTKAAELMEVHDDLRDIRLQPLFWVAAALSASAVGRRP